MIKNGGWVIIGSTCDRGGLAKGVLEVYKGGGVVGSKKAQKVRT